MWVGGRYWVSGRAVVKLEAGLEMFFYGWRERLAASISDSCPARLRIGYSLPVRITIEVSQDISTETSE